MGMSTIARATQQATPAALTGFLFRVVTKQLGNRMTMVNRKCLGLPVSALAHIADATLKGQKFCVLLKRHAMVDAEVVLASGQSLTPGPLHLRLGAARHRYL